MSNLNKKIELLANIAIIVVAILLGVIITNRYLLTAPPKPEAVEGARIKTGMKLSLSGVIWDKADKTLLLVLSTNCRFCTESALFYQRLAQQKTGHMGVRLIAVLPQSVSESEKYLNDHGVFVDEVTQAVPTTVYARATPTLILVDRTGSVVESWVGKLPPEKEFEVMRRLWGERIGN
jgi:hypothetical protein